MAAHKLSYIKKQLPSAGRGTDRPPPAYLPREEEIVIMEQSMAEAKRVAEG
ncbi:MAG: hypothetical protein IT426_09400 [Pirellulales bacterium]|nr:hypothetical protein [Pirellulales bacterium]